MGPSAVDFLTGTAGSALDMALTAAPWLLVGLIIAGVVQAAIPEASLRRWLGGAGVGSVARAAVVGAPLPLCSCGAIPTALTLYRGGASRGASTAFLVGTPGIGVDSVVLTWALLGPFMAVMRPLGAVATAVATGLSVGLVPERLRAPAAADEVCGDGCCEGGGPVSGGSRLVSGLRYAMTNLLDDIGLWLVVGLVLAGVIVTLVPPDTLAVWGSGLLAMAVLAVIGIPMYICATAATPIAAGLLLAGVSPGTVLVFLLAGPITSMATLAVLRREMGGRVVAVYLATILVCAIAAGLLTDAAATAAGLDPAAQLDAGAELVPDALKWAALAILVAFGIRPLRRRFLGA